MADTEVVLVDDASTDSSVDAAVAAADGTSDAHVVIVRLQKNVGVGGALAAGIAAGAAREYYAWCCCC